MQQMWGQIAMIGMLAVCTAQDIRRKEIRVNFVLLFGILGIFLHMLFRMLSIGSLLLGMLVGIVLLLLGLASEGRIGTGDGVLLTVTGIYLGPERNLTLFFGALVLCGIWALGLLALRKKRRTDCIPFVPFLLAAYMGMMAGA